MSISCQISHPQQVCSGNKWSYYEKKLTYNRCVGKLCSFLAKLATYYRCVVAVNVRIMTRNEPTIGVWWKYMSISGQIRRPQQVCSDDKLSSCDEKWTYNRCVVEKYVHYLPN